MRSDERKVQRILGVLLSNAFKFTEEGEVRVTLALGDGRVTYTVQDTGIGVSPEVREVIFEEFRQADSSTTRRFGGSGLGLALARRYAHLLGGEIELAREEERGATFTVTLPLESDPHLPERLLHEHT
jgi:signal transduction histidine kinase